MSESKHEHPAVEEASVVAPSESKHEHPTGDEHPTGGEHPVKKLPSPFQIILRALISWAIWSKIFKNSMMGGLSPKELAETLEKLCLYFFAIVEPKILAGAKEINLLSISTGHGAFEKLFAILLKQTYGVKVNLIFVEQCIEHPDHRMSANLARMVAEFKKSLSAEHEGEKIFGIVYDLTNSHFGTTFVLSLDKVVPYKKKAVEGDINELLSNIHVVISIAYQETGTLYRVPPTGFYSVRYAHFVAELLKENIGDDVVGGFFDHGGTPRDPPEIYSFIKKLE